MRSSKYNDYRVLKIFIALLLVAAVVFVSIKFIKPLLGHEGHDFIWKVETEAGCYTDGTRYKYCLKCDEKFDFEPIPAGHDPAAEKKENVKESTCTEGGSYDMVVRCNKCNEILSSETVQEDKLPHSFGAAKTVTVDSKCLTDGYSDKVKTCRDCGYEEKSDHKVIPAKGHKYVWTLNYLENLGEYVLTGSCGRNCKQDGDVVAFSEAQGVVVEYVQNKVTGEYELTGTYTYEDGSSVVGTYECLPHQFDALVNGEYIYELFGTNAKFDEVYGVYYDYGTPGIELAVNEDDLGITYENVWDENGFAIGVYHCESCDGWFTVNLYNPEFDTRINNN